MSDLRYAIVRREFTKWERAKNWWLDVIDAIQYVWTAARTTPDKTYNEYVRVGKDDPRYESAPFACHIDEHPLRFKFENGKYVLVKPEEITSSEPNPNWHDA